MRVAVRVGLLTAIVGLVACSSPPPPLDVGTEAPSEAAPVEPSPEALAELRDRLPGADARDAFDECLSSARADADAPDAATCMASAETRLRLDAASARQEEEARIYWAEHNEREHSPRRAACEGTDAYRRYAAIGRLKNAQALQAMAQESLDRDAAIEKGGGVSDLALRASAGAVRTQTAARFEEAWNEYRQSGGTAANPDAVENPLDPCAHPVAIE